MKLNEKLDYRQLCAETGVEPERGSKQQKQLKQLQERYDIEVVAGGGRNQYIIHQAYDDETRQFIRALNAPVQQLKFEARLFEACLHNPNKALILSNTQLLKTLSEVNDNFSFTFDWGELNKIDEDLSYMTAMSKTVYKILYQWTMRKIDSMDKRMLFIKRRCFRLYKNTFIDGGVVRQIIDVPINSLLESQCQTIWSEEVDKIDSQYKDDKGELLWMPEGAWRKFERAVDRRVTELGYDSLKRVIMLSPPTKEYMINRLKAHYATIKDLEEIQTKAQQKVLETTQLDQFTKEQREEYIKYNMTDKPPYWFKERAKNIKKEQGV